MIKSDVTIDFLWPNGEVSEGLSFKREIAAGIIRRARNQPKVWTVSRLLRSSHVVLRNELGTVIHLTWAESEQRVARRLAQGLADLEWRRAVL